jgi:hypothetical protein
MRVALPAALALVGVAACQSFLPEPEVPPEPEGITTIKSKIRPGASIAHKEVSSLVQDNT